MRDAPRVFLAETLAEGAEVELDRERAHYLRHVLRLGAGDAVRVFNPGSGEWLARLVAGGKAAVLRVDVRLRAPAPGGRAGPALIFAALKRDATDLVVRMAVELGAGALHPVRTERTVAGRINEERLGAIAREAAEQCERLDVPPVGALLPLPALLDGWDPEVPIAAAVERRAGVPRLGRRATPGGALLVGPEGGFSPGELDALARRPFVHPVSLGPLVLRAETACAVGLGLLQAERGDVEPG